MELGTYVLRERELRGLSRSQLAALVGYRSAKGARRIHELETTGEAGTDGLLDRVTQVLDLQPELVRELVEQKRRREEGQHERWLDEPIPVHLVIRVMPAVYVRQLVPANRQSEPEALRYAQVVARRLGLLVFLVLSRRVTFRIEPEGGMPERVGEGATTFVGGERLVAWAPLATGD